MAPLLSRLFSNRKRYLNSNNINCTFELTPEFKRWQAPHFNAASQVRVLLYRDCDLRGRKLLFDSASVRLRPATTGQHDSKTSRLSPLRLFHSAAPPPSAQHQQQTPQICVEVVSQGHVYEYLPKRADIKDLGEMVLGSVALSSQSTSKLHCIRSPPQMMFTVVFPLPPPEIKTSTSLDNSTSEMCISRRPDGHAIAHSMPMDVPSILRHRTGTSDSLPSLDSGALSGASTLTRSGSSTNLHRRILRNLSSSIELDSPPQEMASLPPTGRRKRKLTLGLAVVISLPDSDPEGESRLRDFIFSHSVLLEAHIRDLQRIIQDSYFQDGHLTHALYQGIDSLRRAISDLYTAPRLCSPAWLSLVTSGESGHFVARFAELLQRCDLKATNFFISTVLTAVLSHHLSWVPTVLPGHPGGPPLHRRAHWVENLAKSYPYNPIWVQLADLYGAVGSGRVTRTVVVGHRDPDLLHRLLLLLSYFIRCSDVCQKIFHVPSSHKFTQERSPQVHSGDATTTAAIESYFQDGGVQFTLGESPGSEDRIPPDSPDLLDRLESVEEESEVSSSTGSQRMPSATAVPAADDNKQPMSQLDQSRLYIQQYHSLRFAPERLSGTWDNAPQQPQLPQQQTKVQLGAGSEDSSEEGYHSMEESRKSPRKTSGLTQLMQGVRQCAPLGAFDLGFFRVEEEQTLTDPYVSMGWSLQAGVTDHLLPDFCLQAVLGSVSSVELLTQLQHALNNQILGEPADEALFIVADIDQWNVEVFQCTRSSPEMSTAPQPVMAPLVTGMCEDFLQMFLHHVHPDICLMHLEDRLQEMFHLSQCLVRGGQQLLDCGDQSLLSAVAAAVSIPAIPCE